jgi:hypothetical protein
MSEERGLILAHCIPHVCRRGFCSEKHGPGMLEFPSMIFVEATQITKEADPAGPHSPD